MKLRKFLFSTSFFALVAIFSVSCDAPTTGTEMYDGDPESREETPDDMQERKEELQRNNAIREQNSSGGGQQENKSDSAKSN